MQSSRLLTPRTPVLCPSAGASLTHIHMHTARTPARLTSRDAHTSTAAYPHYSMLFSSRSLSSSDERLIAPRPDLLHGARFMRSDAHLHRRAPPWGAPSGACGTTRSSRRVVGDVLTTGGLERGHLQDARRVRRAEASR